MTICALPAYINAERFVKVNEHRRPLSDLFPSAVRFEKPQGVWVKAIFMFEGMRYC
jgi:hypothetical protein